VPPHTSSGDSPGYNGRCGENVALIGSGLASRVSPADPVTKLPE